MGHLGRTKHTYKKLIEKVDSFPIGIVEDEVVYKVLAQLYTPMEAEIVSRMPIKPSTLDILQKKVSMDSSQLRDNLDRMAGKGIVFKIEKEDKAFYGPMWSIPGFIEMAMMKVRDDIPQKEVAILMEDMMKDKNIVEEVFRGDTQFGRALVDDKVARETSDILPYEMVTEVVKEAKKLAVVLCYCRHKAEHAGHPCKYPQEVCLAMGIGAEFLSKQNFGREIDNKEALDIIEMTSELGLMHIGDNVKNDLSFICNCCKCCCCILKSYHDHGIFPVAIASTFVMEVDDEKCVGCDLCTPMCQVKAIEMGEKKGFERKKALIDSDICLGCGICYRACKKGALRLKKREKKIITPEIGLEKYLRMAIERGKLQDLIFDNVYSRTHALLRLFTGKILKNKGIKQYLLQEKTQRYIRKMLMKKLQNSDYDFVL